MIKSYNILDNLLTAIAYNRDESQMIDLCNECIKRLKGEPAEWTDDGNIVFGFLTYSYGDYGTSPRGGWIDDPDFKAKFISTLVQFRKKTEQEKQWYEEGEMGR